MLPTSRTLAFAFVTGSMLFATGCGSNNKGKILGKWQVITASSLTPTAQRILKEPPARAFVEFKPDGTVDFGIELVDVEKRADYEAYLGGPNVQIGRYRLFAGDDAEITGLQEYIPAPWEDDEREQRNGYSRITIVGDVMTMTTKRTPMTLIRVK